MARVFVQCFDGRAARLCGGVGVLGCVDGDGSGSGGGGESFG